VIAALLREARPKQWAKNVLVLAAPGAAGVLDDPDSLWRTLVAFVAFCLVSSGTYYWNDILDIEADRSHPTKRSRPIASGAVPLGVARVVGTALLVGGIALAAVASPMTALVLAIYVVITTVYSSFLKHVAVIDLVAVASGFVLRAIAGAVAADVEMSTWFLLTTSFGSLFIVTAKRYAELRELTGAGPDEVGPRAPGPEVVGDVRVTLEEYSFDFLRTVLSVTCGAALVSYCLWAFDTKELAGTTWPFYELSIVPMVTALLRYTLVVEQGHGSAPEEIFLQDRTLQILGVVWLVVFGLGVYV
jgi:decaprenyl-phosphate phosphoribosyltransferase